MSDDNVHELCIIGTGFGGLGAAIKASEIGIDDIVLLERAQTIGGTWRDNTYPGCACDIPSNLYSFSFRQNPNWTRSYPSQPEIRRYLEDVCNDYNLLPRIRFSQNVTALHWLDDQSIWRIDIDAQPSVYAKSVICATGPLSQPADPAIAGLANFSGQVFHSAKWDHNCDLHDKSIGVIGTGASSIQLVPEIAPQAKSVTIFQRTPSWVLPRNDEPTPQWRQTMYRRFPFMQRLRRLRVYLRQELLAVAFIGKGAMADRASQRVKDQVIEQINDAIDDPHLAAKLVPTYRPGCKRILISNDWYPTLARPNVELVTTPIQQVESDGVRTNDGELHRFDVLILATGFAVSTFPAPMSIYGKNGLDLQQHWQDGASTYLGLAVSEFPNLWFLAGPGTGLGHNSIVFMIEAQLHSIIGALAYMREQNVDVLELSPNVEHAAYAEQTERIARTVWTSGCQSWYQSDDGRVDTVWPGTTIEYWFRTRRFRPELFHRFGATVSAG